VDIEGVSAAGVSTFLHGEGTRTLLVSKCDVRQAGGASVAEGVVNEVFNVGSHSPDNYTERAEFVHCRIAPDPVNGDHAAYLLGSFGSLVLQDNTIGPTRNDMIKLWGNPGETTESVWIEGNTAKGGASFVTCSHQFFARRFEVSNNQYSDGSYFIYSEGAFGQASVEGNASPRLKRTALLFMKNSGLAVQGAAVVQDNDFDGYGADRKGSLGVELSAFERVTIRGNRLRSAGKGAGASLAVENVEAAKVEGNASDAPPSHLRARPGLLGDAIQETGNSWNKKEDKKAKADSKK
jgi:hypothetical protein